MKQYKYTINGTQFDVTIDSINGSQAKVEVNGIPFEVTMHGSSLVEEDLPPPPLPQQNLPQLLQPKGQPVPAHPSRLRSPAW